MEANEYFEELHQSMQSRKNQAKDSGPDEEDVDLSNYAVFLDADDDEDDSEEEEDLSTALVLLDEVSSLLKAGSGALKKHKAFPQMVKAFDKARADIEVFVDQFTITETPED
jgi:hypothetical protein